MQCPHVHPTTAAKAINILHESDIFKDVPATLEFSTSHVDGYFSIQHGYLCTKMNDHVDFLLTTPCDTLSRSTRVKNGI